MAGRLIIPEWMPAIDGNGDPISGATAYVYENKTTTLATIYADQSLTLPLANPLTSNSAGQFDEIWVPDDTYFSVAFSSATGPQNAPFSYDDIYPSIDAAAAELVFAQRDGANLNLGNAEAFRESLKIVEIRPEDYKDISHPDDTISMIAAKDAAKAIVNGGGRASIRLQTRAYVITSPIVFDFGKLCFGGEGVIIDYQGANRNVDILTFGSNAFQIVENELYGFTVRANGQMTAGSNALRLINFCRSTLYSVYMDGQDGTSNLADGFYFDKIDQVVCTNIGAFNCGTGAKIRGAVGAGAKAGLFLMGYKFGFCTNAFHIGGAFGGVYFGPGDMGSNGCNVLIDQALANEPNREVMFGALSSPDATTDPARASIIIDQPSAGALFVGFSGTWVCSSVGHGIWIKQAPGCRIMGHAYVYNHAGDGWRIDEVEAYCLLGGQVYNVGGYGVNPNVASHKVVLEGMDLFGCALGEINTTFPASRAARFFNSQAIESLATTFRLDNPGYITLLGGVNPAFNFDANDYLMYNRGTDTLELHSNGNLNHAWKDGRFQLGDDGEYIRVQVYFATADGTGRLTCPHGDVNMPARMRIISGQAEFTPGGQAYELEHELTDGANFYFFANANAISKPCRVTIWYADTNRWS